MLDFFRELRERTGATVVFVHHTGHTEPERMRGSSDLEGYWESKVVLTHNPKSGVRTITAQHREAETTPRLDYLLAWHERSETIALTPVAGQEIDRAARLQQDVEQYVTDQPGQISDEVVKGVGVKATKVREALEAGRLAGRLWKSSGARDGTGRQGRRGSWWPSAHAAIQHELSRPDDGTTPDDQPHGAQVVPPSPPLGDGGTDDLPRPDDQEDETTMVANLIHAFDATEVHP